VLTLGHFVVEQYEHIVSDLIGQRATNYLMQLGVDPAYIGAVAAIIQAARFRATLVTSPSASHLTSFPLDA